MQTNDGSHMQLSVAASVPELPSLNAPFSSRSVGFYGHSTSMSCLPSPSHLKNMMARPAAPPFLTASISCRATNACTLCLRLSKRSLPPKSESGIHQHNPLACFRSSLRSRYLYHCIVDLSSHVAQIRTTSYSHLDCLLYQQFSTAVEEGSPLFSF